MSISHFTLVKWTVTNCFVKLKKLCKVSSSLAKPFFPLTTTKQHYEDSENAEKTERHNDNAEDTKRHDEDAKVSKFHDENAGDTKPHDKDAKSYKEVIMYFNKI